MISVKEGSKCRICGDALPIVDW